MSFARPKSEFKVFEKRDSQSRLNSFINKTKQNNNSNLKLVQSGLSDISDLCYLQIKGQSQLEKEIRETQNIQNKLFDESAIHRNEITHEMEPLKSPTKKKEDKVANDNESIYRDRSPEQCNINLQILEK